MKKYFKDYRKLIFSFVIVFAASLFGSFFTSKSVSTWYSTIIKPSFNPPNYLFGPVWTLLFILMAIALYMVWVDKSKEKYVAMKWFSVQLTLNVLWSALFFGLRAPLLALIEIIILEASIIWTTIKFWKINPNTSYLMLPYILWVGFATILNLAIVLLN